MLKHRSIAVFLTLAASAPAQPDPNRGLWVGEINLGYVNEVTVPLDEDNKPVAPQSRVPTPTSDDASLRVILHVNGAGQVSLLRDVALVKRKPDLTSENDIALLTDDSLYADFPPQAATRIASAAFDFGDPQATEALTRVVDAAVDAAYASVSGVTQADLADRADREAAEDAAFAAANASSAAPAVVPTADVAAAFSQFLATKLDLARVDKIADAGDPEANVGSASDPTSLRGEAKALADSSFYGDTRASMMVDAIVEAVLAAAEGEEQKAARTAASVYADLDNDYQRFIAGEQVGDLITSAAVAAGAAAGPLVAAPITALNGAEGEAPIVIESAGHELTDGEKVSISGASIPGLDGMHQVTVLSDDEFQIALPFTPPTSSALGSWVRSAPIVEAVENDPVGNDAEAEAIRIQVTAYSDGRAVDAIDLLREAIISAAIARTFETAAVVAELRVSEVAAAALAAGRETLADEVPRFPLPPGAPSSEYTEFVRSEAYRNSAEKAARAVAAAMVEERATNALATEGSIRGKGRAAAQRALEAEFSAVARSAMTFVRVESGPVGGGFGAAKGDARLTAEIGDQPLGEPALEATLVLPANHPTNPFRHRRHPDHTVGFEIKRELRFDFDAADPSPSPRAGFGVDRLTGVYREQIFGLHKPLGDDPANDPVGLLVEGRFELYRISLIDTLNAR